MSEQLTLAAEPRERAGKGASRAIRREGRVPAVIYGNKQDPVGIHVEEKLLATLSSARTACRRPRGRDVGDALLGRRAEPALGAHTRLALWRRGQAGGP